MTAPNETRDDDLRILPVLRMTKHIETALSMLDGFTPEQAQHGADAITWALRSAKVVGYVQDPGAAIPDEDEWGMR